MAPQHRGRPWLTVRPATGIATAPGAMVRARVRMADLPAIVLRGVVRPVVRPVVVRPVVRPPARGLAPTPRIARAADTVRIAALGTVRPIVAQAQEDLRRAGPPTHLSAHGEHGRISPIGGCPGMTVGQVHGPSEGCHDQAASSGQ